MSPTTESEVPVDGTAFPRGRLALAILLWGSLIGLYLIFLSTDYGSRLALEISTTVRGSQTEGLALLLFGLGLMACLLLPFSPATLVVLAGVSIWGAAITFWVSFASALVAATVAYCLGRAMAINSPGARFGQALAWMAARARNRPRTWLLLFAARAIPNPLYDAWGYAAGMARVPFWLYLSASAVGGSIPLALVCWLGSFSK